MWLPSNLFFVINPFSTLIHNELNDELTKEMLTKDEFKATEERLRGEIKEVRGEIKATEERLKTDLHKWRADRIKWIFIFWIGQIAALTAIIKLMLK